MAAGEASTGASSFTRQFTLRSSGRTEMTSESVVPATKPVAEPIQGERIVPGDRARRSTLPSAVATTNSESTVATRTADAVGRDGGECGRRRRAAAS